MATILRTRAVIQGVNGLPGLATFYWLDSTLNATTASAALAGVRSYFEAIKAYLASGVAVVYNDLVDVLQDTSGTLTGQIAAAAQTPTTSSGSNELPPATQLGTIISTGVALNGRILRGRSFIGPCTSAAFDSSGNPGSGAKTAITTGGSALLAVTGPELAVWHRPTNGSGGVAYAATDVTPANKGWVLRSRRD